jgi:hypothetical protein
MSVERKCDMHPTAKLRLRTDSDGDIIVTVEGIDQITGRPATVSVEFCSEGAGGGQSPNTVASLRSLIRGMQLDSQRPTQLDIGDVLRELGIDEQRDQLAEVRRIKRQEEHVGELLGVALMALSAWDNSPLPKSRDGMMQDHMERLRETLLRIAVADLAEAEAEAER